MMTASVPLRCGRSGPCVPRYVRRVVRGLCLYVCGSGNGGWFIDNKWQQSADVYVDFKFQLLYYMFVSQPPHPLPQNQKPKAKEARQSATATLSAAVVMCTSFFILFPNPHFQQSLNH